jgi:BioD-like phosphotransacetylase family protein
MKNIIIGSISENAGKTSFIVGLGKTLGQKFAYLKPFGDRLIYRKKRLWDYDSALVTKIFGLDQSSICTMRPELRTKYRKWRVI